jgi:hypothetical protein
LIPENSDSDRKAVQGQRFQTIRLHSLGQSALMVHMFHRRCTKLYFFRDFLKLLVYA